MEMEIAKEKKKMFRNPVKLLGGKKVVWISERWSRSKSVYTFAEAVKRVDDLNKEEWLGVTNWRLPTVTEMEENTRVPYEYAWVNDGRVFIKSITAAQNSLSPDQVCQLKPIRDVPTPVVVTPAITLGTPDI